MSAYADGNGGPVPKLAVGCGHAEQPELVEDVGGHLVGRVRR